MREDTVAVIACEDDGQLVFAHARSAKALAWCCRSSRRPKIPLDVLYDEADPED
jgi:hypothetical protein